MELLQISARSTEWCAGRARIVVGVLGCLLLYVKAEDDAGALASWANHGNEPLFDASGSSKAATAERKLESA